MVRLSGRQSVARKPGRGFVAHLERLRLGPLQVRDPARLVFLNIAANYIFEGEGTIDAQSIESATLQMITIKEIMPQFIQ